MVQRRPLTQMPPVDGEVAYSPGLTTMSLRTMSIMHPYLDSMPRPTRDYALAFRRDIRKLDERIAKLHTERLRLTQAYALLTGDETTYGVPAPPLVLSGSKTTRSKDRSVG